MKIFATRKEIRKAYQMKRNKELENIIVLSIPRQLIFKKNGGQAHIGWQKLLEIVNNLEGVATVYTDGGARDNPGPGAIGAVIANAQGDIIAELSQYIGDKVTNNESEYQAIVTGLEKCKELGIHTINLFSDSELIVKQLNGDYAVNGPKLKELWHQVRALQFQFLKVSFNHVNRRFNQRADQLVNQALDQELTLKRKENSYGRKFQTTQKRK